MTMKSVDLETELTCSICTDLLYQPLTLLNCLHTFCGFCLKEWFGWQLLAYEQECRLNRPMPGKLKYTCPSCRASVRETRPNATVTTLLDMYVQANPHKGKSLAEKKEISQKYNTQESVIPTVQQRRMQRPREQGVVQGAGTSDGRLAENMHDLDLDAIQSRSLEASAIYNTSSRLAGSREQRGQQRATILRDQNTTRRTRWHTNGIYDPSQAFQASHQSSLRSILSNSDLRSEEMTTEIIHQIVDEGLLDGVELDRLTSRQEDELSEMIAQAYRRRQADLMQSSQSRESSSTTQTSHDSRRRRNDFTSTPADAHSDRLHTTASQVGPAQTDSHDQTPVRANYQEGLPHQEQQQVSQPDTAILSSLHSRSSVEISGPAQSREILQSRSPRPVHGVSEFTEHSSQRLIDLWTQKPSTNDASASGERTCRSPATNNPLSTGLSSSRPPGRHPLASPEQPQYCGPNYIFTTRPKLSCSSCDQTGLESQVYYRCRKCVRNGNQLIVCIRCYRKGVTCDYWRRFSQVVRNYHGQEAAAGARCSDLEPNHILEAERLTSERPHGIQRGVFCDMCLKNANDCYWQCDKCNRGSWGFCQTCVNQARHCTHPLLPLKCQTSNQNPALSDVSLGPLELAIRCNQCAKGISLSVNRFHCPTCNNGNYDICNPCWQSFGRHSSPESRMQRLRQCPSGHRMQIVGFNGERRVVVEDVVGGWASQSRELDQDPQLMEAHRVQRSGWAWKDDADGEWKSLSDSTPKSRIAQNAERTYCELGVKMVALWPHIPDYGVQDELMFPRGAEIGEVTEINGDWCWGYYCAQGGLFPSNFARRLD